MIADRRSMGKLLPLSYLIDTEWPLSLGLALPPTSAPSAPSQRPLEIAEGITPNPDPRPTGTLRP